MKRIIIDKIVTKNLCVVKSRRRFGKVQAPYSFYRTTNKLKVKCTECGKEKLFNKGYILNKQRDCKCATAEKMRNEPIEKSRNWKGGITFSRDSVRITLSKKTREQYARHLFKQVYGEIPKGYVIIHKDNNPKNNNINNLECISRADNLKRNSINLQRLST